MLPRRDVCAFIAVECFALACAGILTAISVNPNVDEGDRPRSSMPLDNHSTEEKAWERAIFSLFDAQEEVVQSVELTISEKGKAFLDLHKDPSLISLKSGRFVTVDPHWCECAKYCFRHDVCLRAATTYCVVGGTFAGGDMGIPYGELTVKTSLRTVVYGVSRCGFSIDGKEAQLSKAFVSAPGTELVAFLYWKGSNSSFPRTLKDGLSGQLLLDEGQSHFQRKSWEVIE